LHGAVRLQGLASSPTPETHVLDACALARPVANTMTAVTLKKVFLLIRFSSPAD